MTIPCVAGPYTGVSCMLRLLNNSTRINTTMNSEGRYEHENDEGLAVDDDRFRIANVPVTSIATSNAQNDAGLFESNFRDERYLPFEGAGVISEWQIELTEDIELRQFDYSTVTDVILHLHYTARESGGLFRENVVTYIKEYFRNAADLMNGPLMRMHSLAEEFPTEWHRFLHADGQTEQVLSFVLGKKRFPLFTQDRDIIVTKIDAFARCSEDLEYQAVMSYTNRDGDTVISSEVTLPKNPAYGGLNTVTFNLNDAGLSLDELDVTSEMTLKLRRAGSVDYASLVTDPPEVETVLLVFHYKLG